MKLKIYSTILVEERKNYMNLYSKTQAAELAGMAYMTLDYWVRIGHLNEPTHLKGRRKFYNDKDIEKIKLFWQKRNEWKRILSKE